MTKLKMIEPDFWKGKGRYDQKKLNKQQADLTKWLKLERKWKKENGIEEPKEMPKLGDTNLEQVMAHVEKSKRGPKPKPKVEEVAEAPVKRGRGRPKGSKNKPKEGKK